MAAGNRNYCYPAHGGGGEVAPWARRVPRAALVPAAPAAPPAPCALPAGSAGAAHEARERRTRFPPCASRGGRHAARGRGASSAMQFCESGGEAGGCGWLRRHLSRWRGARGGVWSEDATRRAECLQHAARVGAARLRPSTGTRMSSPAPSAIGRPRSSAASDRAAPPVLKLPNSTDT